MARKRGVLKKSKSGAEAEFFVLNNEGYVVNDAAKLIKLANKKYPGLNLMPEYGKSIVEVASYPSVNVLDIFIDLLEKIKKLIIAADEHGYVLLPLGSYPGKFNTGVVDKRWYREQEIILGKEKSANAALCCGFHYHYTLPKGVFDYKTRFLKSMVRSKIKQSLIDSYNLSIAMDPAITTFMQSSPFVQGKYLAKDSRALIYRGGKKLRYMKGVYSRYQSIGGLPPYKQTLNDLIFSLEKRQQKWKQLMIKHKLNPSWIIKKDNILAFTWNPIRINKIGTLEIRSADMNHPKYIIAMSSLLKFVFRKLYRDFYRVLPSDIGLKEPFKVEGNVIHIPPHTHIRNVLQKESVYRGFASREIFNYCKRFFNFAKNFLDVNYVDVVKPLQEMLKKKETVSDFMIKKFRRAGYRANEAIPNNVAAEVALKSCVRMLKETDETEAKLYRAYA